MEVVFERISNPPHNLVGASLLAKRVCQSPMILLIYRFREQARSHRGYFPHGEFAVFSGFVGNAVLAQAMGNRRV